MLTKQNTKVKLCDTMRCTRRQEDKRKERPKVKNSKLKLDQDLNIKIVKTKQKTSHPQKL